MSENDNLEPIHSIDEYPHIVKIIKLYWGDVELMDGYINSLGITERTNRHGFPPRVLQQLIHLNEIHKIIVG